MTNTFRWNNTQARFHLPWEWIIHSSNPSIFLTISSRAKFRHNLATWLACSTCICISMTWRVPCQTVFVPWPIPVCFCCKISRPIAARRKCPVPAARAVIGSKIARIHRKKLLLSLRLYLCNFCTWRDCTCSTYDTSSYSRWSRPGPNNTCFACWPF